MPLLCPEAPDASRVVWCELLSRYAELLFRWSGRMNLVADGDRGLLASRHILPSLALRPLLRTLSHRVVLDVGSGAGLPGVPLKITLPGSKFILVEARRRRVTFLREVVRHLELQDVEIVHSRLESWDKADTEVDLAISRAAMATESLVELVSPFVVSGGAILTTLGSAATTGEGMILQERVRGAWGERHVAAFAPRRPHQRG